MKIEYWFEMPNKWTFKQKKLLSFISKYIPKNAKILIPFAGKFRFGSIDGSIFIYNDIDFSLNTEYHMKAYKLKDFFDKHYFDSIIADPPFSHFQFYRSYNKAKKKEMKKILKLG